MKRKALRTTALVAAMALGAALFGTGFPAHAQMTERQIIAKIEGNFGVKVLNVQAAKNIGENVLAVTVMNPPGNFNEAFQINTLAVDKRSGNLVPVEAQTKQGYRHGPWPVTSRASPRLADTP